jgi:four helix bundle protein
VAFDFENLEVWNREVNFSTEVYQVSTDFPKEELFGLTAQLRRSAISIALNIAEGAGRHHKPEFIRFLRIARGSLYEVVTALLICLKLDLISKKLYQSLYEESNQIARMINGLINFL